MTYVEIEHRCGDPRCVIPAHLRQVTKDSHCALPDWSDGGALP